tara:strand:+ start:86 stop:1486 length:1401 start_codon:yes stop_codon:yes gene_type:complete
MINNTLNSLFNIDTTPVWKQELLERISQGEKSFRISLKIFGEALTKSKANNWTKAIDAAFCQRPSSKRTLTDVIRPFYFKINPDTGRCWGFDLIIANLSNVLIIPLKDIEDPFGNTILTNHIYQLDGNTGLVAQTQIANDMVDLPKSYVKEDFLAKLDDTLDFDVIAVSSYSEIEKYYDVLDNTMSAKSKDDNYGSVLVGHNLMNYETGKTDLVQWTTTDMDSPLNLIIGQTIPKPVSDLNKIISPVLPIIQNVREETASIVKWGKNKKAIFKAFCLDLTSLELSDQVSSEDTEKLLTSVEEKINVIADSSVQDYWNERFFATKPSKGSSKIDTSIKSFAQYVVSTKSSWTQLQFTMDDYILWELFSVNEDDIRDSQDQRIYGHGGKDILGGKDRTDAKYQSLNYLRTLYLYSSTFSFTKRFSAIDAFDWASDNIAPAYAAIDEHQRLELLSGKKIKAALKGKIYS